MDRWRVRSPTLLSSKKSDDVRPLTLSLYVPSCVSGPRGKTRRDRNLYSEFICIYNLSLFMYPTPPEPSPDPFHRILRHAVEVLRDVYPPLVLGRTGRDLSSPLPAVPWDPPDVPSPVRVKKVDTPFRH